MATDSVRATEEAGLRYIHDDKPGITRCRAGRGFSYREATGRLVRNKEQLRRIKSLAIPPAWTDVWICPDPSGHIQATGRDARRRKQYKYHPRWRKVRDEAKYHRILDFGRALPRIRQKIKEDLSRPGLPREKVLATVVRLLEMTLIRVGNEEYARENHTFGLTTLQNPHVDVASTKIAFHFRGKAGKPVELTVRDRRLARIVRSCQDLPGQELFQYVDEAGEQHGVQSQDVNDYLRSVGGDDFSAKDFRTWGGTVLAALALQEFKDTDSKAEAKRNVTSAIKQVAARLRNTAAICRKCYVHPEVVNAYLDGTLAGGLQESAQAGLPVEFSQLEKGEALVLAFLQRRLATEGDRRDQ